MPVRVRRADQTILQSLLEVGVNLSVQEDRQTMLEMILREARALTRAEAGTLYVLMGGTLQFVAAQNDKLPHSVIEKQLKDKELSVGGESLAGFVAKTARMVDIPDSHTIPPGSPFRIDRRFDAATGYCTRSVLAIPLMRPNGQCVGVLELINRVKPGGAIGSFRSDEINAVTSLGSMAAVTIHNSLLQDQLKEAQLDCIIRLSVAAEFRDNDTAEHIRRISQSSGLIAAALGKDRDFVERIRHASPMHDIGKIGVPDAILCKAGLLNCDERRILQKHALIGANILHDPPNELIAMAREVALNHHERFDGTGYPRGLSGEQIPLSGRIVGLADVFDALVWKRCYKEPSPVEGAIEEIRREEGKHFDPQVTGAFRSRLDVVLAYYGSLRRG